MLQRVRGADMREGATFLLGLGAGALMGSGHPVLAVAVFALGAGMLVWSQNALAGWLKAVLTLGIAAIAVLGVRAIQDERPSIRVTLTLTDAAFADGTVIDGILWKPEYRRYSFSVASDAGAPIVDLQATIYMPDFVVHASESSASGMACMHTVAPKGTGSIAHEGALPQLMPDAALTNVVSLTGSRVVPGGHLSLNVITLTGGGLDEGLVVVTTNHDYWGSNVTDPRVGYRILVPDKTARTVNLDVANPRSGDFQPTTITGGFRVPDNLPPGKGVMKFTFPLQ